MGLMKKPEIFCQSCLRMTNSVTSIAKTIDYKVKRQAKNVVINLADSPMSASTLGQYIQLHPVLGLDKLFIIKNDKVIV